MEDKAMTIKVTISPRSASCFAEAEYSETSFIVKKGGKVTLDFAEHIRGGKTAKKYRSNPECVGTDGTILKDCVFNSPSTAAQFVTGRSTNGYEAWKVDAKTNLGKYLSNKGLR